VEALRKALDKRTIDRFEVGDVIRWTASERYTYAAIKTNGGWYTTARTGNPFIDTRFDTFEELVEVLSRSEVSEVYVSTAWEAI
jgi:hypothetical protein